MSVLLAKNYTATAAITYRRIVRSNVLNITQAAANTDALIGVSITNGTIATGGRVDVAHVGEVEIDLGGTVASGAPVTADADGKAVAAAPVAGTIVRIVGFMTLGGVSGDVGRILLVPGVLATPAEA